MRAVRPGAIETREQERWVHAQRAVDAARDARRRGELACLLGGAIGDALGYRVEFDSLAAIRREYGPEGIRLAAAGGVLEVSDDTQMTLFTLEGQAAGGAGRRAAHRGDPAGVSRLVPDAARRVGARAPAQDAGWLRHAVLWQAQAPGNTCLVGAARRRTGHRASSRSTTARVAAA